MLACWATVWLSRVWIADLDLSNALWPVVLMLCCLQAGNLERDFDKQSV
jgi:hypothetical protein